MMSKKTIEHYGFGDMDSKELEKQICYWMRVKSGLKRQGLECAWQRTWWLDALGGKGTVKIPSVDVNDDDREITGIRAAMCGRRFMRNECIDFVQ